MIKDKHDRNDIYKLDFKNIDDINNGKNIKSVFLNNNSKDNDNNTTINIISEELKNEIDNLIKRDKILSLKSHTDFLFKHKIKKGFNFPKYIYHKKSNNLLIYIRN